MMKTSGILVWTTCIIALLKKQSYCEGYSFSHKPSSAFIGTGGLDNHYFRGSSTERHYQRHSDGETPSVVPFIQTVHLDDDISVDNVEAKYGMPWQESIDPSYSNGCNGLFYMDFWEWQMRYMKENLTNLRVIPTTTRDGEKDLTYKENSEKGARVLSLCFESDEYRKIRMTVYDAGNATQVFTSLWYPQPEYNLPILGIDLLQFNKANHMCMMDFQPIQASEEEHADPSYEKKLRPIREQYPSLQGKMTKRFYDEAQFFSTQMLFGRFDDPADMELIRTKSADHPVYRDFMPAYQQYVQTHVNMVKATKPDLENVPDILSRHTLYDNYSCNRDPAHALFVKNFGQEFADDFVYDVMFTYGQRGGEQKP